MYKVLTIKNKSMHETNANTNENTLISNAHTIITGWITYSSTQMNVQG